MHPWWGRFQRASGGKYLTHPWWEGSHADQVGSFSRALIGRFSYDPGGKFWRAPGRKVLMRPGGKVLTHPWWEVLVCPWWEGSHALYIMLNTFDVR